MRAIIAAVMDDGAGLARKFAPGQIRFTAFSRQAHGRFNRRNQLSQESILKDTEKVFS